MVAKTAVHIFVNRRRVDLPSAELTGAELLQQAGFTGQGYDLLRLKGEGDPTGGGLVMANEGITVKNGEHFRAIPGNRTFGA